MVWAGAGAAPPGAGLARRRRRTSVSTTSSSVPFRPATEARIVGCAASAEAIVGQQASQQPSVRQGRYHTIVCAGCSTA